MVLVRIAAALTLGLVVLAAQPVVRQSVALADSDGAEGAVPVTTPPPLTLPQAEGYEATLQALIRAAALRHGADADLLVAIAVCESALKPGARGPDGAAGMFQIAPPTWVWAAAQAGLAGASPYDPIASAEVAAWILKNLGPRQWGCP